MTAYGFWLPNDPRGSWSEFVASWELYKFGPATKVDTKLSLARTPHDANLRAAAKRALKYRPVRFDAKQRILVAEGFSQAITEADYCLHALCIGYDHAHAIVARHERTIEQISRHLKSKATMALTRADAHPLGNYRRKDGGIPTPWAEGEWSVFINDIEQLRRAIMYVELHPMKEGLPPQVYLFVRPFAFV